MNTKKHKTLLSLVFPLAMVCTYTSQAQKYHVDFLVGQYDNRFYVNDEFNDIFTETSNTSSNLEYLVGLSVRKEVLNNLELQLGVINYSTFVEGMLFYDTTEDQIFGRYVNKGHTFGARTYSFPLKSIYSISVLNNLCLTLGLGVEYFLLIDREPIGPVNLGRQHPRLNDFLPRIDEAFFRNRLIPIFTIGLRYKRFNLELQTRINPEYSFSTFEFEGQEFQPNYWRKVSSFTFSYNFFKFGK